MRERIWNELTQCKHHHVYTVLLIAHQRQLLNALNITILVFSTAGIMGWGFWKEFPLASCIIVAIISLLKLISPHIIPSEKQIDKLDQITDFYFDYYNKMEQLWLDHFNHRVTDEEAQSAFYKLKDSERSINKIVNEIVKRTNKRIFRKTEAESINYFKRTFNT